MPKVHKSSHTFAPEYQLSGIPFVSSSATTEVPAAAVVGNVSSAICLHFPGVTRWVQIRNIGANDLQVGFTALGAVGRGAATGSNPIDGTSHPQIAGHATELEAKSNHKNYYIIPAAGAGKGDSSVRWELKCTKLFFAGDGDTTGFSVVAGITAIPETNFFLLSGSQGFRGVG